MQAIPQEVIEVFYFVVLIALPFLPIVALVDSLVYSTRSGRWLVRWLRPVVDSYMLIVLPALYVQYGHLKFSIDEPPTPAGVINPLLPYLVAGAVFAYGASCYLSRSYSTGVELLLQLLLGMGIAINLYLLITTTDFFAYILIPISALLITATREAHRRYRRRVARVLIGRPHGFFGYLTLRYLLSIWYIRIPVSVGLNLTILVGLWLLLR